LVIAHGLATQPPPEGHRNPVLTKALDLSAVQS
jgi:hypothetical protein